MSIFLFNFFYFVCQHTIKELFDEPSGLECLIKNDVKDTGGGEAKEKREGMNGEDDLKEKEGTKDEGDEPKESTASSALTAADPSINEELIEQVEALNC